MILPNFELVEPLSIQEACAILQKNSKAKALAGGTDLLVNLKRKNVTAELIVALEKIPTLKRSAFSARKGMTIGSMVTVAEVNESPAIKEKYPVLSLAAGKLGSLQVRNRATLGGNICSARPAGDTLGALIAYDAVVQVAGANGEREESLEKLIKGPGKTSIKRGELLTSIILKAPAKNTGGTYIKFAPRSAMEIATVSITTLVTLKNGVCASARIVLGAVGPTFVRAKAAEKFLVGKEINEENAAKAGELSVGACDPHSSIRASAEYRRHLVNVLTKRALLESAVNASR